MNKVVLVGRLTKDIELKVTPNNTSTCSFTVACDRQFKTKDGTKQCDFINCVAWRQSAEYLNNYAHKGDMVALSGSIQTRNYEGQNGKVYVTEVVCDEVNLLSYKPKENKPTDDKPLLDRDLEEAAKQFANESNAKYVEIKTEDLPFY